MIFGGYIRPVAAPSRKRRPNQWRGRWENRDHCGTSRPLGEAKQRGTIGNTVSRTGIFFSPLPPLSDPPRPWVMLVLYFEKGACAIYCNLSPVGRTWTQDLTSLGCLPTGGQPYIPGVYFETRFGEVNKTRCAREESSSSSSSISEVRRRDEARYIHGGHMCSSTTTRWRETST